MNAMISLHRYGESRTAYAWCVGCDREHSIGRIWDDGEVVLQDNEAAACGVSEADIRRAAFVCV